jgi:hypothetical protein
MECPKCGFVMDAFTTECPRCARMAADGMGNPTAHNASPGAMPPRYYQASRQAAMSSTVVFGLRQIVATLGAVLLLIGVFVPLVVVPMFNVSLMGLANIYDTVKGTGMLAMAPQNTETTLGLFFMKYTGIIMICLAAASLAVVFLKRYEYLWMTGGGAFAITAFIIGYYIVKVSEAQKAMGAMAASFGGLGGAKAATPSLFSYLPLGWGPVLLLIGAIAIFTAAALPEDTAG